MGVPAPVPDAGDMQPVEHELRDRVITGLVTGVPMLALGVAAWRAWEGLLRPGDVVVFAILYVLTGLGVTVGFHRLFTHRSLKARPAVRAVLAVLGSAAIEGPVTASTRSATCSGAELSPRRTSLATCSGSPFRPSVRRGTTTTTRSRPRRGGLGRWQLDPSALVIRGLESRGLAWDVVRISPDRQQSKALGGADGGGA